MSQNGQAGALLIAAVPMEAGTVFGLHEHTEHQIAWTDAGIVRVAIDDGTFVLPPSRALWIPAGVPHETASVGTAVLRGAFLDARAWGPGWTRPQPLTVGPMLASLLLHLGDELRPEARARAEAMLPDLLEPAEVSSIGLPMPADARAAEVAQALVDDPADPRTLAQWGRAVGASTRTLSRGFTDGTGVTFGRWRAAARVRAALALLADGQPVTHVAPAVGYRTPSAFVAAFRRHTGTTPGAYFRT